jgi:hypothetical protein
MCISVLFKAFRKGKQLQNSRSKANGSKSGYSAVEGTQATRTGGTAYQTQA